MWCTLLSEGCIVFITIHFTAVTFLCGINSVCHGMNNILTTFMYLHFDCLQLCVYLLLLLLFFFFFFVQMCQMKVDEKWLSLWREMTSLVKASYRWNCAKRSWRVVIGYVTLGDWKMERSESENWSSVRASNEGLKKIDDSRNMDMKGRVKLFIFVVHPTKRERCTNNWTIPKKKKFYPKNWI